MYIMPPYEKNIKTCPDKSFDELINLLKNYFNKDDKLSDIRKVYEFIKCHHKNQYRKSGEPYVIHPIEVAKILVDFKTDRSSIIASLLHDIVEDTNVSLKEIENKFGVVIANLVDGLTKIRKIKFRSNREKMAENFRKMILAMAKDLRVILIKLADRLHNMRTIDYLDIGKRKLIAQETLDIYAPFANRLGVYKIKSELEDLCFRQLKYVTYKKIAHKISLKKNVREAYINELKELIIKEINKYKLKNFQIYGRPKHFYSIYKKMVNRKISFEDIKDLFALRVIVDSIKDCYEVLGIIHSLWKPMPGRFKDYIAMPKANMYQSLHTTVIIPGSEPVEIQIRTKKMHEICENGIAAHWHYKTSNPTEVSANDFKKFSWLRQMMQWQSELKDPGEFLESLKIDLFDEEIFVFTPKGDVISLAIGSTALDFAFAVHTDIGLSTIGSKVNGKIMPIRSKLMSGDIVEIYTSKIKDPSKDWLKFVTTSKAKNKIRSYLRNNEKNKIKLKGKKLLENEFKKRNIPLNQIENKDLKDQFLNISNENNFEDLLISIGYHKIKSSLLLSNSNIKSNAQTKSKTDDKNLLKNLKNVKNKKSKNNRDIIVSGLSDLVVHISKCCNPIPGEPIIGFMTKGQRISIHKINCPIVFDLDLNRKLEAKWSDHTKSFDDYSVCIRVIVQDNPGLLAEITSQISSCKVSIQKANMQISKDMTGILKFEIKIKDSQKLQEIISKLQSLKYVLQVDRLNYKLGNF